MLTYTTQLLPECQGDFDSLVEILEWNRLAFNEASKLHFGAKKNSIVDMHKVAYRNVRGRFPHIPSQVVIRAEHQCLASYRSAKSNRVKLKSAPIKKSLNMRLDKRLYSTKGVNAVDNGEFEIRITTSVGRRGFKIALYDKLNSAISNYPMCDPEIFFKNGKLWISMVFDNRVEEERTKGVKQKLALGVDLGIRVVAATSSGKLLKDKRFNKRKRAVRFNKRCLQKRGTKSAKRRLKRLRRREKSMQSAQTHRVSNWILAEAKRVGADTVVLEDLKGLKGAKKGKRKKGAKNMIGQVPFYDLRMKLSYKAARRGIHVLLVNPKWTSQTDSVTGRREGERRGRRFYATNGLIYDSDINAARNIGQLSKLPVSYGNILDGQAAVSQPNVSLATAWGTSPRL